MSNSQESPIFDLVVSYETAKQAGMSTYFNEEKYDQLIDYFEFELMYPKALVVAEEAISKFPNSVKFLFRKIHLQIFSGEFENALMNLDFAEAMVDDDLDINLHRAYVLGELGISDKAINILNKLEEKYHSPKDQSLIYYYKSLVKEQAEMFSSAYSDIFTAVELDYSNEQALEKMYWSFSRKGSQVKNIQLFKKVVDQNPYSWWGWFNLAVAYQHDCFYEKAIDAFEFAIAINEQETLAHEACADLYMMVRKYEKALPCLHTLLANDPLNSELLLKIAICYIEIEKIPTAKKYLLMANEEGQFEEEVFFYFAECCKREGRIKYAIPHYKEAINICPFRDDFYRGLAEAYMLQGKYSEVKKMYRLATEVAPDYLENWIIYAEFLFGIGQTEEAAKAVEEASYYFDTSIKLKYYRIAYAAAQGEISEAKYYLHEALLQDFDSRFYLFDAYPEFGRIDSLMKVIDDFDKKRLR